MTIDNANSAPAVKRPGWARRIRRIAGLSAVFLTLLGALLGWRMTVRSEPVSYGTSRVEWGDLFKTITATGKLQAVVTVQVGSQVSGRIAEIKVDYNTRVKQGEVIAKLDPSLLRAQLQQAEGNLAAAEARLKTAESTVTKSQANVTSAEANSERLRLARDDAERAYRRMKELLGTGAISVREVESAEATLSQADAQLRQAEAQVAQAKADLLSSQSQVTEALAQVKQTKASVDLAAANLDYSIIRAPIDGVVVERSVDVGQTVA
jgi:HlyD family secretion protein